MVSSASSARMVSDTVARWVLLMAFLLAGCRSWFAVFRRVSLFLHKDRGQVPVVNDEEEASPPSYPLRVYPLGVRRVCAGQRHPRKVVRTSLPSRVSPKCCSPHLTMPRTTSNEPSLISRGVRQQALQNTFASRLMCGRFQRLGANAGGGSKRGSGRYLSCEVVVVRRAAGSAAAGGSSGRGPAASADRTRRVASKPARVMLFNLSTSSGIKVSAVALGTS